MRLSWVLLSINLIMLIPHITNSKSFNLNYRILSRLSEHLRRNELLLWPYRVGICAVVLSYMIELSSSMLIAGNRVVQPLLSMTFNKFDGSTTIPVNGNVKILKYQFKSSFWKIEHTWSYFTYFRGPVVSWNCTCGQFLLRTIKFAYILSWIVLIALLFVNFLYICHNITYNRRLKYFFKKNYKELIKIAKICLQISQFPLQTYKS